MKHSYLVTKENFILCYLAKDSKYLYGEIVYGNIPIKGIKSIYFHKKRYYKYWTLQGARKKLIGKAGEETTYQNYIRIIKDIYRKYYTLHPLLGEVFRIKKGDIKRILLPIDYQKANNQQKDLLVKISKKLGIPLNSILIGGSGILFPGSKKINRNDFDIIINGEVNGVKASNSISGLIRRPRYQEKLGSKKVHPRRFIIDGIPICPFATYPKEDFFERLRYRIKRPNNAITAEILDDSYSLFSPAIYRIKSKKSDLYLISYFVGHNHLLRKGQIIKFKAPLFKFYEKSRNKTYAYVIPFDGSWIEIKKKLPSTR